MYLCLALIWVGFLGVRFEVWGEGKLPCLKLARVMLVMLEKIYLLVPKPS